MKKPTAFLLVIALLMCMTSVAATGKVRVGNPLSIYYSDTIDYPANTAFHIAHGWINPINLMGAAGKYNFSMEIDTVPVKPDFFERTVKRGDVAMMSLWWVFNFPEGMTGMHTFTGHWTGPCQGLVNMGVWFESCPKANAIVESHTSTVEVTFFTQP
jgi:hypothetical protein